MWQVKQEFEDAKAEGATDITERLHNKRLDRLPFCARPHRALGRDLVERKMSDCGFALGYAGGACTGVDSNGCACSHHCTPRRLDVAYHLHSDRILFSDR